MEAVATATLLITVGRLGEGCLTGISIFAQNFLAAFAKPLLPAGRFISRNLNKNKMKATGLKLICERADGAITTWHDVFETTVEDVIRKVRHQKRWMGGKFLEAYLEFDNDGKYYKVYLDVKERGFNQLLGS